MTKHNYIPVKKLEEMGSELTEINVDLELLRGYSERFERAERLTKDEIYISYIGAFKFLQSFFYKAQRLEEQLDDIAVILLESGNYETLQEYLPQNELNLPKTKG